jgi:hypothetical protein
MENPASAAACMPQIPAAVRNAAAVMIHADFICFMVKTPFMIHDVRGTQMPEREKRAEFVPSSFMTGTEGKRLHCSEK